MCVGVRVQAHVDMHRFEKISNIIKQFKLSCSKMQSQFQGMTVGNSSFTAFVDNFTSNTYVMVIMSDPLVRTCLARETFRCGAGTVIASAAFACCTLCTRMGRCAVMLIVVLVMCIAVVLLCSSSCTALSSGVSAFTAEGSTRLNIATARDHFEALIRET